MPIDIIKHQNIILVQRKHFASVFLLAAVVAFLQSFYEFLSIANANGLFVREPSEDDIIQ